MKKIPILLVLSFAFLCLIVCLVSSDLVKNVNTDYPDTDIDGTMEYHYNPSWTIINFNQGETPPTESLATECRVPTSDSANQSGSCGPN